MAVIERFFERLMLPPDALEPNDTWASATVLGPNAPQGQLTLHSPRDEDNYAVDVPSARASAEITIQYDKDRCAISAQFDGQGTQYCPQSTASGLRFVTGPLQRARYRRSRASVVNRTACRVLPDRLAVALA